MKDLVQRMIARGAVGFKPPTQASEKSEAEVKARILRKGVEGIQKRKADRAYEAARKRRMMGYNAWKPRGPGRPPIDSGFCRWCGRSGHRHSKGCQRGSF